MCVKLLKVLFLLSLPISALAEAPRISTINDLTVIKNSQFTLTPSVENPSTVGSINWTKAYGPDDVKINPVTGSIYWFVPSDLPSESFHLGIKASNGDGTDIENFIIHVDVPKIVTIGNQDSDDYPSLAQAFDSENTAGTTFVVRNGIYSGDNNYIGFSPRGALQLPPEGTPSSYTTVMAKDPGEVTLNNGALIHIPGAFGSIGYLAFKGFLIENGFIHTVGLTNSACSLNGGCKPHHIKFIRNGVMADEEVPFNAFRSDDILFENNYAFGGGRYKFASYQSNRILWRRNVARRDRSTITGEPKGTYSVYTTMDALAVNNIAIDGDQERFAVTGERSGEFACPTTSGSTRVIFERSIQLNREFLVASADFQAGACDGQFNDIVSWDIRPAGIYVKTRAASLFNHVTFGNIKPRNPMIVFFNGWVNTDTTPRLARGVINSVLHDFRGVNNEPMFYGMKTGENIPVNDVLLDRYGIDTVNITEYTGNLSACCTDVITATISNINPMYSSTNLQGGIRYLTRVEQNSNLSGLAKDGGDLGATVMTLIGKSGTLFGEPGYDDETNTPMWPYPFEDKIKEKFATYNYTGPTYTGNEMSRSQGANGTISGARGFSVDGESLTNYIWGYLGSTVPPFSVTATAGDRSALIKWNPHPDNTRSTITGFRVYNINPVTGALTSPRVVSSNNFELLVQELTIGTEYHFVVTAVDSVSGEGSYSYSVSVIPATRPKPLPPVLSENEGSASTIVQL